MQAIVFPQAETIAVERVADPTPEPDEVVVQIARCGICGTDVHIYRNEYMSTFPVIPGHEFGGTGVEVGRDVTDVQVGARVAVDPNLYCGHCDYCRNEQANHCRNWQGVGITRPGAFAEYVAVPARACYRLPDTMTDLQAAFIEPLACVVHACKRLRIMPGEQALIFGAGPMGLLLLQALRHSSTSAVVMVDKQPDRLALASVQLQRLVVARARLDALRRAQTALGALEDAVQRPLAPATALPAVPLTHHRESKETK